MRNMTNKYRWQSLLLTAAIFLSNHNSCDGKVYPNNSLNKHNTPILRGLSVNENFSTINEYYENHQILSMAPGRDYTCILDIERDIYCWGRNGEGQLGYGNKIDRTSAENSYPVDIGSNRVPKEIFVGSQRTCVLLETDDLLCWGFGSGLLNGPSSNAHIGDEPNEMGNNLPIVDFGPGRKVKKVSMGFSVVCCILDNDMLKCFDSFGDGVYVEGEKLHMSLRSVARAPYVDLNATTVYEVSVGSSHACAITDIGLKCFGRNENGQHGYGDLLERGQHPNTMGNFLPDYGFTHDVQHVYASSKYTCALFNNSQVKCWGNNGHGQLGYGTSGANNVGDEPNELPRDLPFVDIGAGNITKLQTGQIINCALLSDHTVKCWGYSTHCSLMRNTGIVKDMGDLLPSIDLGSRKVKNIFGASEGHLMCVIFLDDSFTCWGQNEYGNLGQKGQSNIGCDASDRGDNLDEVCARDNVEFEITTDSNPKNSSWQFFHSDQNILVMETRSGYYTLPNHVYKHEFCAPKGSYGFQVEYSLGKFNGTYEVTVNNDKFHYKNAEGFTTYDEVEFLLCNNDTQCSGYSTSCATGYCNEGACDIWQDYFHSDCTKGKATVLVLRGRGNDYSTTYTKAQLSDNFFGLEGKNFTMTSQFAACSYNQFNIVPYGNNGVLDVLIYENVEGKAASYVAERMLYRVEQMLKKDPTTVAHLLILCLPPNTVVGSSTNWKAYAFVNSYVSIYNDMNCVYPSVQIHEIGHNFGLSHSNDDENYGDLSGMMGRSFGNINGPIKCFNAPKSWQLDWYSDGYLQADANEIRNTQIEFVGISDYKSRGNRATHLKIINTENGYDYFISFNRATGINIETGEGIDEILISRRRVGVYYDDSTLVARLGHLQRFSLYGVGSQGKMTLQMTPNIDLSSNPAYARLIIEEVSTICQNDVTCDDRNACTTDQCISNGTEFCVHIPKTCGECGAVLELNVQTNDFPDEILWDIQNMHTNRIVQSSTYYEKNDTNYTYQDCFEYGKYLFTIFYANSTTEYENTATFNLTVGNSIIDEGLISDLLYITATFSICSNDTQCYDYNGCTVDFCNLETKLCNNSFVPENEECNGCSWFAFDLIFDNFPEETAWKVIDIEKNALVESGEPYPIYLLTLGGPTSASGRRKAPTRSGRRKAPTRSGRRKAPTRSGRRKAPTRAAPQSDLVRRTLEEDDDYEEDDNVYEMVCLETHIKYQFTITDSFGDGMCCTEGQGSYNLTIEDKEIRSGGVFGALEEITFKITINEDDCNDDDPSYRFEYDPDISACIYYPVNCDGYGALVQVILMTDVYADDTSWKISTNNLVVMEGKKYELAFTQYESVKCLPFGSYLFDLVDPPSDGMAFCFEHDCGYSIEINNATLTTSDGSFGGAVQQVIGICTLDKECDDNDICTIDSCDADNRVCVFEKLSCSECNKETLIIDIYTDILFSLTSWTLQDITGPPIIFSGGPYVKSFNHYQHVFCIDLGSYNFTVTNSEGRGMSHCYEGSCGFTLAINNNILIENDGSFEYSFYDKFVVCDDDSQCNDNDVCTLDSCDTSTRTCVFEKQPCSFCNMKDVAVNLKTDGNASETSWKIKLRNEVLASGGKYAKNYSMYNHSYCLTAGDYEFTVFDSAGNGFTSCNDNTCGFEVKIEDELVLKGDGSFSDEEKTVIGFCSEENSCDDDNICTVDTCDTDTKICKYTLNCTSCNKDTVSIIINTDLNPEETTWVIRNQSDILSLAGGPFASAFTHYEQQYCLGGGNYTFSLYDKNGDGMAACTGNSCGYEVEINNEPFMQGDGIFQYEEKNKFEIESNETRDIDFHFRPLSLQQADIISVAVGFRHTCAIIGSGSVYCWGNNDYGQLGYGDIINRDEIGDMLPFVSIGDGNNGKEIYAGAFHTCLLLVSDELKCWGYNEFGQLGVGSKINIGSEPFHMGNNLITVDFGNGKKVKKVSLGYLHSCAILSDDSLKCFGSNAKGQLGYERQYENVGDNENELGDYLSMVNVGYQMTVDDVSAGFYHTCVQMNEKIKCFGSNSNGELGYGDSINRGIKLNTMGDDLPFVNMGGPIKQVSAANSATCTLFLDGKLKCFGSNIFGQLGYGDKIQRGNSMDSIGEFLPSVDLGNEELVKQVTRGSYSFCALIEDSFDVKCWGWNYQCTLGSGDKASINTLADMGNNLPSIDFGSRTVQELKMFQWHVCAICTDNSLSCWGFNRYSQLGYGHEENIGCKPEDLGNNLNSIAFYESFSWLFEFDKVSTTENLNELVVEYNVSKSFSAEHYAHTLLDPNCLQEINDSSIEYTSFLMPVDYETINKVFVNVFFNYSLLETTPYWARTSNQSGSVDFCIRSYQMAYPGEYNSSVKFYETKILTHINFDLDFRSVRINDVRLKKDRESEIARNFIVELSACLCDIHKICMQVFTIHENSRIHICVRSLANDVELKEFNVVQLYQDGILKYTAIEDGVDMPLTTTSYGSVNVINTRLITAFFEDLNPSPIYVKGRMRFDFLHGRLLLEDTNNEATFQLKITLPKEESFSHKKILTMFLLSVTFSFIYILKRGKDEKGYVLLPRS